LPGRATSIFKETGKAISRNELLIQIIRRFEKYYPRLLTGTMDLLYDNWNRLSLLTGREVELDAGDEGTIRGKVLRIERDGALVIEDRQGEERRIRGGDVTVSRIE
jgi:BirA family biotin operon repressor/biotin-[acetyl-CoA-carboxylase] ligase